jgi:hypothetical protein
MLEFFAGSYVNATGSREKFNEAVYTYEYNIVYALLSLSITAFATYLAWECNAVSKTGPRVFKAVGAFLFPLLYLIYYLVVHTLFGEKC